jgi:L-rhamnose mutarotase
MKRFAQAVMLKNDPEIIRRYEDYHAHIWPEVLEGTIACGVKRVFIYRFGTLLFMFMEAGDDFDMERDMPKYMANPKAAEWDRLMRTFQEPLPGAPQGSTWVEMKEVYAMDLTDPAATEKLRKSVK